MFLVVAKIAKVLQWKEDLSINVIVIGIYFTKTVLLSFCNFQTNFATIS